MSRSGAALGPNDGELVRHKGWEAVIKLGGDQTDGAFSIVETRHDPGTGAGAHVHSRESETFVVLEGTVTFRLGDEVVELGAGGIAHGPPGTIHDFRPGRDGCRLLHVFVPAGMEGFFRPRPPGSIDAIRRQYGVETVNE